MITDPISNFLTRLRNANSSRRKSLTVHSSKIIKAITNLLAEKGFIESFEENITGKIPELIITLRSERGRIYLKRISKPGQRIYYNASDIKRVRSGAGIGIFSTSKGILSDQKCREQKIGGEYICEVY
ncbi:30S ribosomal protein S8 [Candidatus Peregrinibacteria bacterium]|nr:30S ribosomal protein S8 [Candidatus Peregrinibacteria bacterium]